MTSKPRPVDISDSPDLLRLAERVKESGIGRVLKRGDQELALLSPIDPSGLPSDSSNGPARRQERQRPAASSADAILNIIGIGESAEPTDVGRRELEYLAEAATPKAR